MNAILLLLLLLASILLSTTATATKTRRKDCYNSGDLQLALGSALPGDDIVLFPGNFQGRFYSGTTQATADNPITIRSAIPSRKAVMSGMMNTENSVVLYITGNYWTVKDLIIENGQKGIVFDGVKGGKVLNCKVHNTGMCLFIVCVCVCVCMYVSIVVQVLYCCCMGVAIYIEYSRQPVRDNGTGCLYSFSHAVLNLFFTTIK